MASEEAIVLRRAIARQDLETAERRVAEVYGVAVDSADPPSRDPDIAAIQQIERTVALLTALVDLKAPPKKATAPETPEAEAEPEPRRKERGR